MNLLSETGQVLQKHNKYFIDIEWIGSKDGFIPIESFMDLANVDYNDGFGSPEVPIDLVIVGNHWWLERHEYDGAECWVFKEKPKKPERMIIPKSLNGGNYSTLIDMDNVDGYL